MRKRAILFPHRARDFVRLAQIFFDFAQDELWRRKRSWLGMTTGRREFGCTMAGSGKLRVERSLHNL